jgi:hypothetical protein
MAAARKRLAIIRSCSAENRLGGMVYNTHTSRIPDSCIPSVSEYLLTESASIDYLKIMTGLIMHCVKSNRRIVRPAAVRCDGVAGTLP